jgi:hypothetical protein
MKRLLWCAAIAALGTVAWAVAAAPSIAQQGEDRPRPPIRPGVPIAQLKQTDKKTGPGGPHPQGSTREIAWVQNSQTWRSTTWAHAMTREQRAQLLKLIHLLEVVPRPPRR